MLGIKHNGKLFRAQRVSVLADGAVMAADVETVERYATTGGFGSLGELLAQNRTPTRTIDLDVLSEDNATAYWDRDEQYDFAVSLNRGGGALEGLCRLLERWIAHFLGAEVAIRPRPGIEDTRWVWHVGLDAEASALLNDLYNRVEVSDERMERLLCLFVRFYLVSILFIIFDLEVAFLFPWAVAFKQIGAFGFWSMMVFLGMLTIGFVYEWRKGALEWD